MRKPTDTREKLLNTAIELIWDSSYSNVGVAEICKQAGVTKGSFYHYFETKADLFYAASLHYWCEMKKELDEIYSPSFTPLEHLENLIEFIVTKQDQAAQGRPGNPVKGCPIFTSGGQAGCGEERVREAAREMSENALKFHMALIRGLKADNMLQGDGDPKQVARLMHQFMQGLLIYGRVFSDLEIVKTDLREGLYRILALKPEFRSGLAKTKRPGAKTKAEVTA